MTLEELLNKLIEKGWKPFPNEWTDCYYFKFSNRGHDFMCCSSDDDDEYTHNYTYSWRDIASKESGLWQFVCKNDMADDGIGVGRQKVEINKKGNTKRKNLKSWKGREEYEYRLIESALKDESELEQFLLDNIKIEG